MSTFTNISTSSATPTTIYRAGTVPSNCILVTNDTASSGVANIIVNAENENESIVTIPAGVSTPIRRAGKILSAVAYASASTTTIYTGAIDR